jgi:hypothetical protein
VAHVGGTDLYNIAEAREAARDVIKAIKLGGNRNGVVTFGSVAEQWVKRHVDAKGLISAPDIKSYLNRILIPAWGGREFVAIKRSGRCGITPALDAPAGSPASVVCVLVPFGTAHIPNQKSDARFGAEAVRYLSQSSGPALRQRIGAEVQHRA